MRKFSNCGVPKWNGSGTKSRSAERDLDHIDVRLGGSRRAWALLVGLPSRLPHAGPGNGGVADEDDEASADEEGHVDDEQHEEEMKRRQAARA